MPLFKRIYQSLNTQIKNGALECKLLQQLLVRLVLL
jgi:hypothetical protein